MSEQEQEPDLTEEEVAAIDAEDGDVHEPDEPDEQDPATQEPEAPDEADSGAAMEAMGKKLDLLQKHVAKRITEILGEAAVEWEECEVCTYWNTPGWRHKGALPQEVEDAMLVALGRHAQTEYKPDEFSRACDKCNGLGEVLTGSKVNGQYALPCIACQGMGWIPIGTERRGGGMVSPNGPAANLQPAPAPAAPAVPEPPEVQAALELLRSRDYFVMPTAVPAG